MRHRLCSFAPHLFTIVLLLMLATSAGCMREQGSTHELRGNAGVATQGKNQSNETSDESDDARLDVGLDLVCELVSGTVRMELKITNSESKSIAFLPNLAKVRIMPSAMDIVIWDVSSMSFRIAIDSSINNPIESGMYEPLVSYQTLAGLDLQFIKIPSGMTAKVVYTIDNDSLVARYGTVMKYAYADSRIPLWVHEESLPWSIIEKNLIAESPVGHYEVRTDESTGYWRVVGRPKRRHRVTESEYAQLLTAVKERTQRGDFLARRIRTQ